MKSLKILKEEKPLACYRFPVERVRQSTNKIYAGVHWGTRKKYKDDIHDLVLEYCKAVEIKEYPLSIKYYFDFVGNGLDTLNCAFMAKCVEDSFRAIGMLEDDDPPHVAESIIEVSEYRVNIKSLSAAERSSADLHDWLTVTIRPFKKQDA
jgi:hypothetical protein